MNSSSMKNKFFLFSILCLILLCPVFTNAKVLTEKQIRELIAEKSLSSRNLTLEKKISDEAIEKVKSQYDTYVSSLIAYTLDRSARANVVFGTENKTTNFNFGLTQLTPSGTQIEFGFNNTREQSDSPFAASDELFESELALSLTQPILKNFFGQNTRNFLKKAKIENQSQKTQVDSEVLDLTLNAITLYWNWYYNTNAKKILNESVYLANELYNNNKKKKEIGLIEASEIHAFAANLDIKKSDLLALDMQKQEAEELLKSQLNITDENLKVGTESFQKQKLPALDQMLKTALNQNPKVLTLKEQLKAQNIQIAIQKNSRLPQLDLLGSLALNGIDPNYGQAFSNIDDYNPVWQAGIQFSFPLQNRAARSDFKVSKFQKKQLLNSVKNTENQVLSSVKAYYKNYKKLSQKVAILASATQNQKLKWQSEVQKYDQGRSDYDFIITYQNEYLQTRLLHLKAKVDMKLEYAKLQHALGSL